MRFWVLKWALTAHHQLRTAERKAGRRLAYKEQLEVALACSLEALVSVVGAVHWVKCPQLHLSQERTNQVLVRQ